MTFPKLQDANDSDPGCIDRCQWYRAKVKIRQGEEWKVKPGCASLDGQVIETQVLWEIGGGIYNGEYAMSTPMLNTYDESWPIIWIASGDLIDIIPITDKEISR